MIELNKTIGSKETEGIFPSESPLNNSARIYGKINAFTHLFSLTYLKDSSLHNFQEI